MISFLKSKIQNPKSSDLLIVITGPTASGKSALAMELAEKYGGEIICADSRTVYRGMDIGTAKPTAEDQARVPHHLLDVADPDDKFTASDFQRLARQAMSEIRSRGHIPFVVGGTGLYIDGLILGYHFGPSADSATRTELTKLSVAQLQKMLEKQHIEQPHNRNNKRYLIRALEQGGINNNRGETVAKNTYVVAIATNKDELDRRIRERADVMFSSGIVREANALGLRYGWDHESMSGNIYPLMRRVIESEISLDDAKKLSIIKDRRLAKRQITWLKRHNFVHWLTLDEAREYLSQLLDSNTRIDV